MDLRKAYPRSPREKLAGYVHLPRMLDKCRATLAGMQGEYIYPCPMDQRLLDFAGITGEQFSNAARGKDDAVVAEWFKKAAKPHSSDEIERWNQGFLTAGPDTDEKRDHFKKLRDAIDPARTDITAWADLLDLDEKRPVPKRGGNR
ncbi:MAG: hypothetical protein A3H49_00295 [Nitrospirae bacterium RIFCSPLOWO2_02_FULL_62_14]|nr:MAG: hypothetical protein A3H49_00295 [Nitrospirae bacterium RIFCSPLOWO2_02_FULL_62_14]OGW69752.1 MAG: hypothetical protein A3A88_09780 [Nitrospirae bacterium RIFCSPLOWO2_01_FULL_62_17]